MKQIVPANGNNKVLSFDCKTDGNCDHTMTWHESIIAYLILTDEDLPEDAEGLIYVRPITTQDAMEHVQSYGGNHCCIVNSDGIDETVMGEVYE